VPNYDHKEDISSRVMGSWMEVSRISAYLLLLAGLPPATIGRSASVASLERRPHDVGVAAEFFQSSPTIRTVIGIFARLPFEYSPMIPHTLFPFPFREEFLSTRWKF